MKRDQELAEESQRKYEEVGEVCRKHAPCSRIISSTVGSCGEKVDG